MNQFGQNAGYVLDDESDAESPMSSEDEIDQFLHGTPEQRRRIRRRSLGQASSSEDEFEKDMEKELTATMRKMTPGQPKGQPEQGVSGADEEQYYDNDYFDSDSDEEATSAEKKQKKHPLLSNDDLLYDPHADDEDQAWVNQQLRSHQPKPPGRAAKNQNKPRPLPTSDAVLDCPACMTTLCIDCQRHELYKHQYRAMFVSNCTVEKEEVLKYPKNSKGKKRKRKQAANQMDNNTDGTSHDQQTSQSQDSNSMSHDQQTGQSQDTNVPCDLFHSVKCSICKTEVGVIDQEEVYHFFNVLASHA